MYGDTKRLWDEVNTAISELLTIGPVGNRHYAERLHEIKAPIV